MMLLGLRLNAVGAKWSITLSKAGGRQLLYSQVTMMNASAAFILPAR